MRSLGLFLVCVCALMGCDEAASTFPDAGSTQEDAGAMVDSGGPATDAGPVSDSGSPVLDAGPTDAGPVSDAGPGLPPMHCRGTEPMIAAIDPSSGVTVFNPTASAMNGFTLQVNETTVAFEDSIPARGTAMVAWPESLAGDGTNGELGLLNGGGNLVDFVCWGTGVEGSSLPGVAQISYIWNGGCSGVEIIGGYTLSRVADTNGMNPEDYEFGVGSNLFCE